MKNDSFGFFSLSIDFIYLCSSLILLGKTFNMMLKRVVNFIFFCVWVLILRRMIIAILAFFVLGTFIKLGKFSSFNSWLKLLIKS